jgi:hypothetical protein
MALRGMLALCVQMLLDLLVLSLGHETSSRSSQYPQTGRFEDGKIPWWFDQTGL